MEDIDIDQLRKDLIDYFGTAAFLASPVAFMDLIDVENASDDKIIEIAIRNHFNLDDYRVDDPDKGLSF